MLSLDYPSDPREEIDVPETEKEVDVPETGTGMHQPPLLVDLPGTETGMSMAGHIVSTLDVLAAWPENAGSNKEHHGPHISTFQLFKLRTVREELGRPHIVLSTGSIRCTALVDTGAAVTLLWLREFQQYSRLKRGTPRLRHGPDLFSEMAIRTSGRTIAQKAYRTPLHKRSLVED